MPSRLLEHGTSLDSQCCCLTECVQGVWAVHVAKPRLRSILLAARDFKMKLTGLSQVGLEYVFDEEEL